MYSKTIITFTYWASRNPRVSSQGTYHFHFPSLRLHQLLQQPGSKWPTYWITPNIRPCPTKISAVSPILCLPLSSWQLKMRKLQALPAPVLQNLLQHLPVAPTTVSSITPTGVLNGLSLLLWFAWDLFLPPMWRAWTVRFHHLEMLAIPLPSSAKTTTTLQASGTWWSPILSVHSTCSKQRNPKPLQQTNSGNRTWTPLCGPKDGSCRTSPSIQTRYKRHTMTKMETAGCLSLKIQTVL